MKIRDYPIKQRHDETTCENCGRPLLVGDWAVCDFDCLFCSEACAEEMPRDWQPPERDGNYLD